jgi:membrane-bound serine protease (ClpP class)
VALAVGALVVYGGADPSGARLSWVTVVAAPVVSTAFFAFLIRKGLAAQRAPALQDLGRLIGLVGEARTTIAREGSVYVAGELWSATAEQFIPAEAPVVVVGRSGLVLKVVPAPQPSREQPAVS